MVNDTHKAYLTPSPADISQPEPSRHVSARAQNALISLLSQKRSDNHRSEARKLALLERVTGLQWHSLPPSLLR